MDLKSVGLKSRWVLAPVLIVLLGAAEANAQIKDLFDRLPPIIGDKDKDKKDAKQSLTDILKNSEEKLDDTLEDAAPMSESQKKYLCGSDAADTGKVGLGKKIQARTVKKALSEVSEHLEVEGIELPEKIQSTCYAEVRWDYIERKSVFWTDKVADATNKALKALDIDHQIEADRLLMTGVEGQMPERSDFVSVRKELDKGFKLLERGMAEQEAVNAALLAEARGAMRGAMIYGVEIIGWDQRLVEFMGDNLRWTINRAARVKNFEAHARLVGETFPIDAKRPQGWAGICNGRGPPQNLQSGARTDRAGERRL